MFSRGLETSILTGLNCFIEEHNVSLGLLCSLLRSLRIFFIKFKTFKKLIASFFFPVGVHVFPILTLHLLKTIISRIQSFIIFYQLFKKYRITSDFYVYILLSSYLTEFSSPSNSFSAASVVFPSIHSVMSFVNNDNLFPPFQYLCFLLLTD